MKFSLIAALAAASLAFTALAPHEAEAQNNFSFSGVYLGVGAQYYKQEGAVAQGEETEVEADPETTTTTETDTEVETETTTITTCNEYSNNGRCLDIEEVEVVTDASATSTSESESETVSAISVLSEPFRVNGSDQTGWGIVGSALVLQQMGAFVLGAELGGEFADEYKGAFAMIRIGIAMGKLMPYIHGGAGYEVADLKAGEFSVEDGRVTGRAGVGAMLALSNTFSIDGNYTFVAGGDLRETFADGTVLEAGDQRHTIMVMGRIKLN